MKKKMWIGTILGFIIALFLTIPVIADVPEKYQVGDNVWCFIEKGSSGTRDTIVFEGTGSTYDYESDGYDKSGKHRKPEFLLNKHLYNIKLSEGITAIGDYLFYNIKIADIDYPNYTLKKIGKYNFLYRYIKFHTNYNDFPKTITDIGYFNIGFNILFPDSFETLPTNKIDANIYCGDNITDIIINNSTRRINIRAFDKCPNLKNCTIPVSVTYIDKNAFIRSPDLTIKGISGSYAETFANKRGIKFVSTGKVEVGDIYDVDGFKWKIAPNNCAILMGISKNWTSVNVPLNCKILNTNYKVTAIDSKAFYKNVSLKRVTIGKYVKNIGNQAFYGCSHLSTLTIGTNVVTIGSQAFYGCSSLNGIILPKNVSTIGSYAFKNMKSLKTLTIAGAKLKTIGKQAFYSNKALKIKLPKSKYSKYTSLIKKSGVYKTTKYFGI